VDCSDPEAGQLCYKDGAYSGCTVGIVAPSPVMVFKKGTAKAATEEEKDSNPENVDGSEIWLSIRSGTILEVERSSLFRRKTVGIGQDNSFLFSTNRRGPRGGPGEFQYWPHGSAKSIFFFSGRSYYYYWEVLETT
jgi:hypothetical protein